VVTGAARGLGRAIAERLATSGHLVVGIDLDADELALRQNRLVRGYYRRRPRHILDRLDAFSCGT
jgi:NAD(P)-dependent dehydrogenase (short-subunit alcohol dehydrogenase family)